MSEDKENLTEKPTEKRLLEAHERGQFARVPELQVVAGLLAAAAVLTSSLRDQASQIAIFASGLWGHLDTYEINVGGFPGWAMHSVIFVLQLALPMMVVCSVAGVIAGGAQSRFRIASKVFEDAFSRLDPIKGFQRVFSKEAWVRLVLDTVKFAAVGVVIYGAIHKILGDPVFSLPVPVHRIGEFIYETTVSLLFRFALALGGLAAINYLYQHAKISKEQMMSRHDVKQEMKEASGDPLIKAAQRQMARRLLQKQMLSAIATADVVVTNPTHFAVALKYERGKDSAPMVLAKGENAFAKRIKALAAEHQVPMVENKPVARALFKHACVGEAIPAELYRAVAEILGYVYRTHRYYFHQLRARRMSA